MSFRAATSLASPLLKQAATGAIIKNGTMACCRAGANFDFLTITLTGVYLSSYRPAAAVDTAQTIDVFTLIFNQINSNTRRNHR